MSLHLRRPTTRALTLCVAAFAATLSGQSTLDVNTVLTQAREALGGDAKLASVNSLSVSGSMNRTAGGHATSGTVDYKWQSPDKFVQVQRIIMNLGPLGSGDVSYVDGFNGDALIHESQMNGPIPLPPDPYGDESPTAKAERRARMVSAHRKTFAQFALPLFASSFAVCPLEFAAVAQTNSALHGPAVEITVEHSAGAWTLAFDPTTHLPVRLMWKAKPVVVVSSSSTTMVSKSSPGRPPVISQPGTMSVPSGDPTAGMSDVDWEMSIGEYKLADGLNWPHRLVTTFAGQKYEDHKLGKYSINPKLSENTFKPSK